MIESINLTSKEDIQQPLATFLFKHREIIQMIPQDLQSLFIFYFLLANQKKTLKYTDWDTNLGEVSSDMFPSPNPESHDYFEQNPIIYLTDLHNQVEDFPNILKRILRMLHMVHAPRSCQKEDFLRLLHNIKYSIHPKIPLTDEMKKVIRIRILYPLVSSHQLAERLQITTQTFNHHIREFKKKFDLYKVIWYDWYKLGLSRIYLFPHYRYRIEAKQPLTHLYFESETTHRLPVEHEMFSIQVYTPPRSKWTEFRRFCEAVFEKNDIRWLADYPALFFSESRLILLNFNTYDPTRRQFTVNEPYLEYCLSTEIFETLPPTDYSPALKVDFDIKTPRETFDSLDLDIIYNFYKLEGYRQRFVTTRYVAKTLNVSEHSVARRIDRMLNQKIIGFYYMSTLQLPHIVNVVVLFKEERLRDAYLNLISIFPYSHHTKLRSYPKGYVGVGSMLWVPPGSRVSHIFREHLLPREDVIGFCAESAYQWSGHRSMSEYWDDTHHRWRLDLSAPKESEDLSGIRS